MSTLLCSSIDPPRFLMPSQAAFLLQETVHVWKFPVTAMEESFLSEDEINYALRFRVSADRNRFVTARQMLRLLSAQYLSLTPREIVVKGGRHQKPVTGNSTQHPFHFNISHSGAWVLISFSDAPLGVDIEEINHSFSYTDLVHGQFSKAEQDFVFHAPDPVRAFFSLWVRKESLLKARGSGLQENLRAVPSLDGLHALPPENNSWRLNSFQVEDHYAAAVAYADQIRNVCYFDGSGFIIQA